MTMAMPDAPEWRCPHCGSFDCEHRVLYKQIASLTAALEKVRYAIEHEEELDGEPPAEIVAYFRDTEAAKQCLRATVRATKKNLLAALDAAGGA